MKFDVVIIGAGICGACIARELAKTTASVCLVDKENDVSCGSSKANSGIIHAGYDPLPGTLMAKYNVRGASLYPLLAEQLHFSYKRLGSFVLAFDGEGMKTVQKLYERGMQNGVAPLRILTQEEVRELEPHCNDAVIGALFAENAGIVSPYQATWAIAENAVSNGVTFLADTMVHAISREADGSFLLDTSKGAIGARFVVNAAGLAADSISRMAGARDFSIVQRRGEYCLLDSNSRDLVRHVLFQTPNIYGKGVLVTQTVDGNILIGPSADDVPANMEGYTGTSTASQNQILKTASLSVDSIPVRNIINSFAGIRAIACEKGKDGEASIISDFIVEEDRRVPHFVNVAGICSPGLSSAPAIAEDVVRILQAAGLDAKKNTGFQERRRGIPSFKEASNEEKARLIAADSRYGQIICRCEMITEGEICAAIHSAIGAVDLDGVKRRTRAGMGRCQAGFCSPRVTEILSRELHIPMINVTKRGGSSFVLCDKTRPSIPDYAGTAQEFST